MDRLIVKDGIRSRLAGSLETAMELADGLVTADADGTETTFSQNYACPDCNISMEELTPRMFSFNSPFGACPTCTGLGTLMKIDPDLIFPDKSLSLNQGAIKVSGWYSGENGGSVSSMYLSALAEKYKFSLDAPVEKLPQEIVDILLYGTGEEKLKLSFDRSYGSGTMYNAFEGIANNLERRYRETQSDYMKAEIEGYMSYIPCPDCGGDRLKKTVLAVTVGDASIAAVSRLSVLRAREFFANLTLSATQRAIADRILREIDARLGFLCDVGLDYLTLARGAATLSGGEAQRIRLATQIGSGLMGVLYILDEPSIGLHQRDNSRLLTTLKHLRDLGNTLIVVEHDEETIREADHVVDIGPLAGAHGGELVAQGTVADLIACERSITGKYLSGELKIEVPQSSRPLTGRVLTVRGARANNLKGVTVSFPLGVLVCITGVSGSGKSSLVNEIVKKALLRDLNRAKTRPGDCDSIEGEEFLDKVIDIDQSPIGRTPRSNPATYTGVFDLIREVFAMTPDAKAKASPTAGSASTSKAGGARPARATASRRSRCTFCRMFTSLRNLRRQALQPRNLEVRYKGKTISDVLDMPVEEAFEFFGALPRIARKLSTLMDVGLGYIRLGRPSPPPCPAARPSASSWRRSFPESPRAGRSTSWTSPPPGCTCTTFPA